MASPAGDALQRSRERERLQDRIRSLEERSPDLGEKLRGEHESSGFADENMKTRPDFVKK